MQYAPPNCLGCRKFKGMPMKFGEKATCSAYPNEIPQSIYPKGSTCSKYISKYSRKKVSSLGRGKK